MGKGSNSPPTLVFYIIDLGRIVNSNLMNSITAGQGDRGGVGDGIGKTARRRPLLARVLSFRFVKIFLTMRSVLSSGFGNLKFKGKEFLQ
jgi:hypothetical protein